MKILICDDHKIVRDGLRQLLLKLEGVKLIGEAGSSAEASAALRKESFDVLLLDISLPDKNGLEVLQEVKMEFPLLRVIMLSMHPQEQYAKRALTLGASGYLTKNTATDELLFAVKKVMEKGKYISSALAETLISRLSKEVFEHKHESLSSREFEIMLRIANGKAIREIANDLFISNKTVSTYRSRIMGKLEFRKNAELTRYCLENNLI